MELIHETPFAGALIAGLDKGGHEIRTSVLKGTFSIARDGAISVAEKQQEVRSADEYLGAPGASSVLHEADGAYFKPGTDVLVNGHVYPPGGRAASSCEAGLRVGTLDKRLRVVGDRRWAWSRLRGLRMSTPEPFTRMPICWERALGGGDRSAAHGFDARNPLGTGHVGHSRSLDGVAVPNFETAGGGRSPLSRRGHAEPQGFGYVGRSWTPRARYAGTYDETWQRERRPLLPDDFDERFFNGAPADQVLAERLRGGEEVVAVHLSAAGVESFRIPRLRVRFRGLALGRSIEPAGELDTCVIDLDDRELVLVWRATYRVRLTEAADVVYARVENEEGWRWG